MSNTADRGLVTRQIRNYLIKTRSVTVIKAYTIYLHYNGQGDLFRKRDTHLLNLIIIILGIKNCKSPSYLHRPEKKQMTSWLFAESYRPTSV